MQVYPLPGFKTFVELKDYIHRTLCQREQLDANAFPITEQVLKKGQERCGFIFSVQGPRSVFFNAIFATEQKVIHFYDSAGERVLTTLVESAPPLST